MKSLKVDVIRLWLQGWSGSGGRNWKTLDMFLGSGGARTPGPGPVTTHHVVRIGDVRPLQLPFRQLIDQHFVHRVVPELSDDVDPYSTDEQAVFTQKTTGASDRSQSECTRTHMGVDLSSGASVQRS